MWFLLSWISNQHKQQTCCRDICYPRTFQPSLISNVIWIFLKKKFQQDHMYQSVLPDVVAILNFRSIQKMKVLDGPSNDNSCIDQVESKVQYFMKTISFIIIYRALYYTIRCPSWVSNQKQTIQGTFLPGLISNGSVVSEQNNFKYFPHNFL